MTINEIRESGLLELYALGTLSGSELTQVEQALTQFPELKTDLNNIERTLQAYAGANAVSPSPGLKNKILQEAKSSNSNPNNKPKKGNNNSDLFTSLIALLSLVTAFFAYSWFSTNQEMQQMEERHRIETEACDSIQEQSNKQYALYQDLTNPNNKIVANPPQAKYPETEIYFYHNLADKKNYLQLSSLPPIDNNTQSYQLWSIIGTNPPQALDVFQSDGDLVIPVQFIEGTEVYAITIEQKGGVQSPTLEDLIGTFTM